MTVFFWFVWFWHGCLSEYNLSEQLCTALNLTQVQGLLGLTSLFIGNEKHSPDRSMHVKLTYGCHTDT